MSLIQRFLLGNRVEDDLQVGLFLKNDGTVWLRNPGGSETQVGAGGGLPASWSVGSNGELIITPNAAGSILKFFNTAGENLGEWTVDEDGELGFAADLDNASVVFIDLTGVYLNSDGSVYLKDPGANITWGGRPGGDGIPREFFQATTAAADGDLLPSRRIQWFDDTSGAPAFRFKEMDVDGTLYTGKTLSQLADGTLKLADLPTSDPGVVDQVWCDTGADNVLKVSQG